ncbi:histidine phosphatase family protein [Colwellia sp. M166]|uniref:SixA phosphatase family protein n=1 Tax=Colwellia sp. M166 TaxID=2583805 RepID=UPI00211E521D|nr:phosphoglycerate mutase family protein [Colwellia sp. M166]|tara:strand:+ start:5822 stop:6313 length:492 start_codon:yes stop_codon:yes gene_type:complete
MKYSLLAALLFFALPSQAEDSYSLYLVRHAEKQVSKDDPKLSQCGELRAKQLATLLEHAQIKHIYSTPYQRTMATATPFSQQQQLAIKQYSPAKLEQFAQQLLQQKENALVVGHSNTTPQLAALLSEMAVKGITEKEYRNLYQIQVSDSGKTLTLFTQPLTCH